MHEYALVQALLDRVQAEAASRGAVRVQRLTLRIGEGAGLEIELFQKAFETFRERTICAAAELTVRPVPVRWTCPGCDRNFAAGEDLQCAACGVPARMAEGDEIILDRIEMEVP